jgi:hypothetical protein
MRRRRHIFALGLVLAVAAAAPATAAKSLRVASEVEVAGANYGEIDAPSNFIAGDVHSKKPKCERNREVTVFFTDGDNRELVDTARTDRTGDWVIETEDAFNAGLEWDAVVARKKISRPGKDIVCKGDQSPLQTIEPIL